MNRIEAEAVSVEYRRGRERIRALDAVSLVVDQDRSVGIAGESGSGKSTLARVLVGMHQPDAGEVRIDGRLLRDLPSRGMQARSRRVQMIFQDPNASLNQRMTVGQTLRESLEVNSIEANAKTEIPRLLDLVRLPSTYAERYPFQLSGGQRQRVAIARALAARPGIVICDEPTSALDVSVQAEVLDVLRDVRTEEKLALAVITHNLDVVRALCDDVVIMRNGRIVERGATVAVFSAPRDDYTKVLLQAVPRFRFTPFAAQRETRLSPTAAPSRESE